MTTTIQPAPSAPAGYPVNPPYLLPPDPSEPCPAIARLLDITADLLTRHAATGLLISSSELGSCITLAARSRLADHTDVTSGLRRRLKISREAPSQQAHHDADQVRQALARFLVTTDRSHGDPVHDTGQVLRAWAAGAPAAILVTGLRAAAGFHRHTTGRPGYGGASRRRQPVTP